jgi:DNA-binding beta-propeller fold protein YncE
VTVGSERASGTRLAGYRLDALLGRGGMGVVYLAYDPRLKRNVALKLLAPALAEDASFRERFLQESELAAGFDHPNIVPVYEAGEADGHLFIAMRYVDGSDLRDLLRDGPLEPRRALALLDQIAAALDAAHERGLVHRDVKPSNILCAAHGGREHCYLADFGLVRRRSESEPALPGSSLVGTVDYVAPETIRGNPVDGRADVYSLGCVLYECLTGEPPFRRGSDAAVLFAHLEEEVPLLHRLDDVLPKALAKSPNERYTTAGELVAAARQALGIGKAAWWRLPLIAAVAGAAMVTAALVAAFAIGGGGGAANRSGTAIRIDGATGAVDERVPVGNDPEAIAAAPGSVWTANFADGTVSRIQPAVKQVDTITVDGPPLSVAVAAGIAFVVNGPPANSLTLIKASAGNAYEFLALPDAPTGGTALLAAARRSVWVAEIQTATVRRIDITPGGDTRRSLTVKLPLRRNAEFDGIATGEAAVWVVGNDLDRRLWKIDPRSGRILAVATLPIAPDRVAAGAGGVWITGAISDVLLRLDPRTLHVVARIRAGRGEGGVAATPDAVWVADRIDGTVTRVDPRRNAVASIVRVGGSPTDVAVSGADVWVARAKS